MTDPLVVVSAGTYHLPFERLSDWIEQWMHSRPGVRVVLQHGPSRPVPGAENHALLPYDQLLALCAEADAVVLQGGAGGVMDMRALGVVPIVVPRVPGSGEVVDDHQLVFTAEMTGLGLVRRALTFGELRELLDAALAQAPTGAMTPVAVPGVAAVRNLLERGGIRRIRFATTLRRMLRMAGAIAADRLGRLRRASR